MFQNHRVYGRRLRVPSLFVFLMVILLGVSLSSSHSAVFAGGVPPAPNPVSPAYGSVITPDEFPPVGIPEVEWESVEGAVNYRVQFSNNIAFTTIAMDISTPNTTYTPVALSPFPDGVFYWRVRVDTPTIGDYSNPMEFTKQWATPTNFPALLYPADGATLEFYDFDHVDPNRASFIWEPVIGAARYRLEIDNSPDFASLVYFSTTFATTHQPIAKLANGTYYWRVVPWDATDRGGTPSEIRTFIVNYEQVPLPLEPADNSFPTFTPTFRWTAVVGAQFYRLQYSTDPTFNTATTTVDTRNTTHTPILTLPNDVNYYWRVRAISGNSESAWSSVYQFLKRWYIQPVPLVPTNNYQHAKMGPTFYWSPVPAASKYRVEVDTNPDFINLFTSSEVANTFYTPILWSTINPTYYWRVIPIDGSGKLGVASEVFSMNTDPATNAPELVYPLYYYDPLVEDPNNPGEFISFHPAEDRTVALPIFVWHRSLNPVSGGTYANAYRLQVDDNPNFTSVNWDYDTQNLHAVPTNADPFVPANGTIYYWRVAPITAIGGSLDGDWSQSWKTRFDSALALDPTVGGVPELLRPVDEEEQVEYTPRLDWWPYSNSSGQEASAYEVQISWDEGFTDIEATATVPYPSYSPQLSIAERHLNKTEFGTFYWRVRAIVNGTPTGWSDIWRFQIAAHSLWLRERLPGDSLDFKIGSDPDDQADNNYELTNIYSTQSISDWYFAFDATKTATNMTYALYLDLDYEDGSGATSDACGYNVTTIDAHRPEYILYIYQISNAFSPNNTALYAWNASNNSWNVLYQSLTELGGSITYLNNTTVEVEIPNTAIGFGPEQGSYNLAVLSFQGADTDCSPAPGTSPVDMAPDIAGPTGNVVERFTAISDRPQLVAPFNNLAGDPTTYPSILPFSIEFPPGYDPTPILSPDSLTSFENAQTSPDENPDVLNGHETLQGFDDAVAPWAGGKLPVYLDPLYTNQIVEFTQQCSSCAYLAWQTLTFGHDILGDNSYYWRFRTRYYDGNPEVLSPWSEGWRIERQGFIPENLQISVDFATPTFSWDIVEGAKTYTLQVDNDPTFGSQIEVNVETTQNSYTPSTTLDNGTYYWRVRVKRENNITNDWSPIQTFTLALPSVQNLVHYTQPFVSGGVAYRTPTLCWDPLIVLDDNSIPVLAAHRYQVQFSSDPAFPTGTTQTTLTEQPCFTPIFGYADGTYYWRVAMVDGSGRVGQYTPSASLTKQYPTTTLLAPVDGSILNGTPTFEWTPVQGAASYKLEVSLSPNFSTIYDNITTFNVRFTPTKKYTNSVFYWRVAMVDRDNKVGPFTDAVIIIDPLGLGYKSYMPITIR